MILLTAVGLERGNPLKPDGSCSIGAGAQNLDPEPLARLSGSSYRVRSYKMSALSQVGPARTTGPVRPYGCAQPVLIDSSVFRRGRRTFRRPDTPTRAVARASSQSARSALGDIATSERPGSSITCGATPQRSRALDRLLAHSSRAGNPASVARGKPPPILIIGQLDSRSRHFAIERAACASGFAPMLRIGF